MANTEKTTSGFTLPAPAGDKNTAPATAGSPAGNTVPVNVIVPPGETFAGTYTVVSDTTPRDMLIGGGLLLVFFVAFFFAKNAYANKLVEKRVSPNSANAAGWWLFVMLAALATGIVLVGINAAKFLTPLILGPVAVLAIVALVLMLMSGRK